MFYAFANLVMRALLRLLTDCRVEGLQNVPREGSLVLVANHQHIIDPPVLGAVLPRKVHFMAKTELFRMPVVGWVVSHYEGFPVRRGEPDRQALEQALGILARGGVLGMFPEGTRSPDGKLIRAHPGAALAAIRSGALVLPVGVVGTRRVPRFPDILLHRPIRITIGPPFALHSQGRHLNREYLGRLTDQMMLRVAALLPPEQRGVYRLEASVADGSIAG